MLPDPVSGGLSLATSLIGDVFKTSAAGPNADAAAAVWPEVQKGNLAAVAAFITRDGINTQSSKLPWANGLAQIPQALINAANEAFPGNNWATFGAIDPSQVLPTVQRLAKYAATSSTTAGAPTTTTTPAAGPKPSAGSSFLNSILDAVGLGPSGQANLANQAGAAAGTAAGQQVASAIKFAVLALVIVVGVFLLLRLRRR